jgi:hypothetical protein
MQISCYNYLFGLGCLTWQVPSINFILAHYPAVQQLLAPAIEAAVQSSHKALCLDCKDLRMLSCAGPEHLNSRSTLDRHGCCLSVLHRLSPV